MPRYRKRSRSTFKKRVSSIARKAAINAYNAKRLVVQENRGGHISTLVDNIGWFTVGCDFGTPAEIRNLITATGFLDPTPTATLAELQNVNKHYGLKKLKRSVVMRNTSVHACYMTCYMLTPRDHMEENDAAITDAAARDISQNLCALALADLANGFSAEVDATGLSAVQTAITSSDAGTLNEVNYFTQTVSHMHPSDSKGFLGKYKILKKVKLLLKPGAQIKFELNLPYFEYHPEHWEGLNIGSKNRALNVIGIKNISKFFMCKLHGELGMDADAPDKTGFMATDIAFMSTQRCESFQVSTANTDGMHVRVTKDNLALDVLEGPADKVRQVGDQYQ